MNCRENRQYEKIISENWDLKIQKKYCSITTEAA
jgi:hypothetical protein